MPENILDAFKAEEKKWLKQERELANEQTKSAAEHEQRTNEIASLVTHPGWRHFIADMQHAARAAYSVAIHETNDRKANMALGETHAFMKMEQWGAANLELARARLQGEPAK